MKTKGTRHRCTGSTVSVASTRAGIEGAGSTNRKSVPASTPHSSLLTITFVYVLGTASANHRPNPFKKPLPSALTRSRTMRPSRRATATLSTVRKTRKEVWARSMKASLEW